ncbi:BTAD domain-containing putative transcriptional regulator [Streptomyces sp. NPDC057496]|uniref:BTAD domain-containing putative transcriptional regulator n=1 Tax=Streptomyces sp. NPDC057496 TaxID=3346149 RepID=UPI0036C9BBB5
MHGGAPLPSAGAASGGGRGCRRPRRRPQAPGGSGHPSAAARGLVSLDVPPEDIDTLLFERRLGRAGAALDRGEGAAALRGYEAALGLWRGGVLQDLPAGVVCGTRRSSDWRRRARPRSENVSKCGCASGTTRPWSRS